METERRRRRKKRGRQWAAVEKPEERRKPERFFGHRNPARRDNPKVVDGVNMQHLLQYKVCFSGTQRTILSSFLGEFWVTVLENTRQEAAKSPRKMRKFR